MGGWGKLNKGNQKVYTFSYKITRDAMYNMMNIINTDVCYT